MIKKIFYLFISLVFIVACQRNEVIKTKTRGKLLKLGRNYLKKNNVLVLEFDKYGILKKKEFYDKDNMKKLTFAKNITENEIRRENFIYSFLSSIRQKMQTKRK